MNLSTSDWIQIFTGASTFLAVIVALFIALFGERIRGWIYRPKIALAFDRQNERCFRDATVSPDLIQDEERPFDSTKRQYFRLRVVNQGSTVARKLRAKVELYFDNKSPADRFEPSTLQWVSGLEVVDLAPEEEEYLNLVSQVLEPKNFNGYRLRIELASKALRGIAWDRTFDNWILKVSIHGENLYTPIVKFFRFDKPQDKDQPGDLKAIEKF